MASLINFFKRMLSQGTPGSGKTPQQAAIALMQARGGLDGNYLAHLSPNCIISDEDAPRQHYLQAEELQPTDVLASWVRQDGRWQPCPAADFLAQRGQVGADWDEFAVKITGDDQAVVVWQSISQVIEQRCGGGGGTIILTRTEQGWVEDEEQGDAWII